MKLLNVSAMCFISSLPDKTRSGSGCNRCLSNERILVISSWMRLHGRFVISSPQVDRDQVPMQEKRVVCRDAAQLRTTTTKLLSFPLKVHLYYYICTNVLAFSLSAGSTVDAARIHNITEY